jgi:hypothetical protein
MRRAEVVDALLLFEPPTLVFSPDSRTQPSCRATEVRVIVTGSVPPPPPPQVSTPASSTQKRVGRVVSLTARKARRTVWPAHGVRSMFSILSQAADFQPS